MYEGIAAIGAGIAEAFNKGYKPSGVKEVSEDIQKAYESVKDKLTLGWDDVVKVIQENWIGEDEQAFEDTFAKKLNKLYEAANVIAKDGIEILKNVLDAWFDFQRKNILDKSTYTPVIEKAADFVTATISPIAAELALKKVEFTADTVRGLKNENSAANIKSAVELFVSDLKQKVNALFGEISAKKGFFGNHSDKIDLYIHKVGEILAEVVMAVKDLYEEIDKLAASQYGSVETLITESVEKAATTLETDVNEQLGASRWNAGS